MLSSSNTLFIIILFFLSQIISKINAEKTTTVEILIVDKPDYISNFYWEKNSNLINQNFTLNIDINGIREPNHIEVHYSFIENNPIDKKNSSDYIQYIKNIMNHLTNSKYDMLILDEKFLFSDNALVSNKFIEESLKIRNLYKKFKDLTEYFSKDELKFHDTTILNKGYHHKHLYGLPYELDFDLLYYYTKDFNNKNNTETHLNLEDRTWDNLLSSHLKYIKPNLLSMPYKDGDDLLNLFVEYVESTYEGFYQQESKNFEIFYNETSTELFESFRNFIINSSPYDINKIVNINLENAYNDFLRKDETLIFKGKASHYQSILKRSMNSDIDSNENINNNDDNSNGAPVNINDNGNDNDNDNDNYNNGSISVSQLPKNYTVMNAKYLVISNYSKIHENILVEVARHLTSKEMQLFRANQFGSVPTFNFNIKMVGNEDENSEVKQYCQNRSDLCNVIQHYKPIDIKKVFESQVSAQFMEVRFYISEYLKTYLKSDNEENDRRQITSLFVNIRNLILDKPESRYYLIFVLYIPTLIFSIWTLTIMLLIYRYRNDPNIKYLSPGFCNIIIFGFLMCILSPLLMSKIKFKAMGYILYYFDTMNSIFLYLPIILITYRIYSIYNNKSKVNFGHKLDNNHLYTFFIFVLLVMMIYATIVSIFVDIYIKCSGSITTSRTPYYTFSFDDIEKLIYKFLYVFCALSVIYMVIKMGYASKQYGEFKFAYIIILEIIFQYCIEAVHRLVVFDDDVDMFVITNFFYMFFHTICTYYLLGDRLLYVIKHRNSKNNGQNNEESPYTDYTTNISNFLPSKRILSSNPYNLSSNVSNINSNTSININSMTSFHSNHRLNSSISTSHHNSNINNNNNNNDSTTNIYFNYNKNNNIFINENRTHFSSNDNDYSIMNNPNNILFNQRLQMLSMESNATV